MVFDTGPRNPHEPRTSQPRASTDDSCPDGDNCDRCQKGAVSHCESMREPGEADGYAPRAIIPLLTWSSPDVGKLSRYCKMKFDWRIADVQYQCDVMDCQEATGKRCRDKEAHFGAEWNRGINQQRRLSTLWRFASKATIAIAAPICFHVVRRYAVSRGFLLSPSSQPSKDLESCYTQVSDGEKQRCEHGQTDWYKVPNLHEPQWLACPDALLFLAASMSAGVLLVHYHQINVGDKHQNLVLATLTSAALVCGIYSGLTLMATNLTVTPWAVLTSLIVSDLLHAMLRARDVRKVQSINEPDGARFGSPTENALKPSV